MATASVLLREVPDQIVRKAATGKKPGSRTYVLSDATRDRYGDIIEPEGWELDDFKRNPIALFNHQQNYPVGNWVNIRVENGQLLADFDPAEAGTSRVADEVRKLADQDILRATSVGFAPIQSVPIEPDKPHRGLRYLRQALLETSIVSVPANPAALSVAKSLNISDQTMSLAFGGQAFVTRAGNTIPGGQAVVQLPIRAAKPMNLSQQIQQTQTNLNAARDALAELEREPTNDNSEDAALYQNEIEAHEAHLARLERSERLLAGRAAQLSSSTALVPVPAQGRRPLSMDMPNLKPRDLLVRAMVVHFVAYTQRRPIDEVLRERYPDHEQTALITRAAVAGATTTTAGWAAELCEQAQADFLANLDPNAIFPRLAAMGVSLTFGPNAASIKIPSRAATPSIGGSFVGEGSPIPVRRLGLTSIILYPHKVGVISAFSREIAQYSNPAIEGVIREGIMDDTAINIDGLLIDAVAASASRPAGLINGVAAITAATGGGYAAIIKDIKALSAPFFAVNAGRRLVLMINSAQGLDLAFTPGPGDGRIGWTTEITNRYSILESTTIPAGNVYMVDVADFVSVQGTPEFDASEQATLHMEDTTPLNIGTAGAPATVAAPTQSMFQTAQIALRMLANVTWAMRRAGMVQWMTGVNWAAP